MDAGGLDLVAKIISRLPNGEYPGANTRTAVLKIILNMPISKQHILTSKVGGLLTFIEKKRDEIRQNRELATKIKNEWKRVILDQKIDYSALDEEQELVRDAYLHRQKLRRLRHREEDIDVASGNNLKKSGNEEEGLDRRRGFIRNSFDFLHRPVSSKLSQRIKKMRDKIERSGKGKKLKKLKSMGN